MKLRRPLTTPSTAVEVLSHRTGPREAETGRKGGNNGRERTDERATDGRTNERTDSVRCSSIRTLTGIHTSQSNLVGNQPALMLLLLLGAPAARCFLAPAVVNVTRSRSPTKNLYNRGIFWCWHTRNLVTYFFLFYVLLFLNKQQ